VESGPITLLDFGKHTEGFERLLPDPKGTPVADGTDLPGVGPALNRWRDGGDFSSAG
jgi:hypothetical protein